MKEARHKGHVLCDSIYMEYQNHFQISRGRKQIGGFQRLEGRESDCSTGVGGLFWGDKNVWN